MSITESDIQKLAKLARIRISDQAIPDVTARLMATLTMIDKIQAQNTDHVEPMANPHNAHQRLRPDTVTETNQRDVLQALASDVQDGLFLVPPVIER